MIIDPDELPAHSGTGYPPPFRAAVSGRSRKRLGEAAGLTHFGVNLTTLQPGSCSALRHWHSHQDEFIYIVSGELTLVTHAGAQQLTAGTMAGFPAGEADGHHLINRSDRPAVYLEVGDRTPGDQATYPDHDLLAIPAPAGHPKPHTFVHRDGRPYD